MACFTWTNEYYHYIFERVGYLENNVRVSLLIGIQVIPLDWNSSASLCFNMTGLSYWLLGKQSEKTTQQHEYLHLRLCLTKRTVCSVVYLHQDSFDNNKRCGLQKLPTCVPGRLSARHGGWLATGPPCVRPLRQLWNVLPPNWGAVCGGVRIQHDLWDSGRIFRWQIW